MRQRILTALLFAIGVLTAWSQSNTLSIPDIKAMPGQTVPLSINLDNTADVVAVQFTVTTPQPLDLNAAALTERAEGLEITFREINQRYPGNQYMAMIYSATNKPIRGRTGTLLTVPMTISSSASLGSSHDITLSDVIIGKIDGSNVVTGINSGTLNIAKSPDFEVSDVTVDASSAMPGDEITVGWKVSNIGDLATTAGWSEKIYLVNSDNRSKYLATVYSDDMLAGNSSVSRNVSIKIPDILGMDGDLKIFVQLTPNANSGEPKNYTTNNSATSASEINVGEKLTITPELVKADEARGGSGRITISHSGDYSADRVFSIETDDPSRISVPNKVTISKYSSSSYFTYKIMANGRFDNKTESFVKLTDADGNSIQTVFNLEDDTDPALSIELESDEVTEGESLKFVFVAEHAPAEDTEIRLTCDYPTRFNIPSIVLPAGQTRVEANIEAKDDNIPDITKNVTFSASAVGYIPTTEIIDLFDNDVPALQMSLSQEAVSESDGPLAVVATLTRTNNIDKNITVRFTDDSNGGLYFGTRQVEMKPGVETVTFNLGATDNLLVDGERTYNITAKVWIAACSCNASAGQSGGVVSVPLTVYDNDGPTLTLVANSSVIREGNEMRMRVERNTETSAPLQVKVSSDHDADLEYPSVVTIPAGSLNTTFNIKAKENDITGDSFTTIVTVESDGFAKSNAVFMVSDINVPDAQISNIAVSANEIEVGDKVNVTATLKNTGCHELPEMTKVNFYETTSSTPLATAYLQAALPAGESVEVSKEVKLPDAVRDYMVYAVVNDGQNVQESNYNNNRSANVAVKVLTPFRVTLTTDKQAYRQGENVVLSGHIGGKNTADKDIDLYLINEGYRQVEKIKTDANGDFSFTYLPYEGQMGHFVAGACYPGDETKQEFAAFDICGVKRIDSYTITCEATLGRDYEESFAVRNFGPTAATGVKINVVSQPENCVIEAVCPSTIEAGADAMVNLKITPTGASTGNSWEKIVLDVQSDASSSKSTFNYYCYVEHGKIEANISNIDATMIKGKSREYPITIKNTGKGETGRISLAIPSWMSTVTPSNIASIPSGESAEVILKFNYSDEMQLNVARKGQIAFNCENASAITIPFNIVPVSEETGTLVVDVTDNYTYYTAEAPHVANAKIELRNPNTNRLVVSGVSGADGLYSVELPEGYYAINVTAENHQSYSNNIYVNPGRESKKTVTLPIEAIKVDWRVEETEVEDEYHIETVVKYETNVPAPVVKMTIPKEIDGDNMAIGESVIINMNLTNVGLITALETTVILPENLTEFTFEALAYNEPFDLAPHQTVNVPIRITKVDPNQQVRTRGTGQEAGDLFVNCMAGLAIRYLYACGAELPTNQYAENLALKFCAIGAILAAIIPSTPTNPHETGIGGPGYDMEYGGGYYVNDDLCDPCEMKRREKCIGTLMDRTPLAFLKDAIDRSIKAWRDRNGGGNEVRFVIHETGEDITEWVKGKLNEAAVGDQLSDIVGFAIDVLDAVDECEKKDDDKKPFDPTDPNNWHVNSYGGGIPGAGRVHKKAEAATFDWNDKFEEAGDILVSQIGNLYHLYMLTFGDKDLFTNMDNQKIAFLDYAHALPDGYTPTDDELATVKPESLTMDQMKAYINRLNGTAENMPTFEDADKSIAVIDAIEALAVEKGFTSLAEYFNNSLDEYMKYLEEKAGDDSVCASISLKINQTLAMTRQAFKGTLTIFNGHDSKPMEDVKLVLDIRDENGNQVTSRQMQINPDKLTGFEGALALGSGWTLNADETGVCEITFIPTKYAAPTEAMKYSFGGSVSYLDPFTGLEVTRNLYPVTLTVAPSPELNMTYFMQRDVIGDDPLTEEVEPCEEAEFSVLINNIGYGDAKNVRMLTEQPEIIDNEKGLLIDFEIMSSQLNGGDKTLALGETSATDFGTIPAKSSVYATWWLRSSLLGHFTHYSVEATHVSSFDNPDLSLLNEITIHELIHSIDVVENDETLKGFVTNDIPDTDDAPDMLYLSNGEIETVAVTKSSSIAKTSDSTYTLTVNPEEGGWNYGNITDPTYGLAKLMGVTRQSDGAQISLRNFWQTDRTLVDGKEPIYENRIHFVDKFGEGSSETYVLTFEPIPDLMLDVVAFEGLPDEHNYAYSHLEEVKVVFNKYIDPSTFSTDDLQITVQGQKQDVSLVAISTEDNKTFTLDLTEFNTTVGNGYYVLTVQTSGITDAEGYLGKSGKSASWVMYEDGLILVNTFVSPRNGGKITGERNVRYGEAATLTAEPAEGYDFSHWTVNNETVSNEPELSSVVTGDIEVRAFFTPKTFSVNVDATEGGRISGDGAGIYQYGKELTFEAAADDDYLFEGWTVNDQVLTDPVLTVTVSDNTRIEARFKFVGQYLHKFTLASGWNWISHRFDGAVDINDLMSNNRVNRVVGQSSASERHPENGLTGELTALHSHCAYKLESSSPALLSLGGYDFRNASAPISVAQGWNWIGYPMAEEMLVDYAFATTEVEPMDVIVGQAGFAQYDGSNWVGTLETLQPGAGYIYFSRTAKDICYNDGTSLAAPAGTFSMLSTRSAQPVDIHKYKSVMPVVATVMDIDGSPLDNNSYELAAYCGNECRGVATVVNGKMMMNVYGNANDAITFRVSDPDGGEIYSDNAPLSFNEDLVGNIETPYTVMINSETGVSDINYDGNIRVYADGDMLRIKGIPADMIDLVEVIDINGRKQIRANRVSESGIRISAIPAGVYVIRVTGNGKTTYHKIEIR